MFVMNSAWRIGRNREKVFFVIEASVREDYRRRECEMSNPRFEELLDRKTSSKDDGASDGESVKRDE